MINVASILNTVGMNCCANLEMQLTVECVDGLAMLKWNIQKESRTAYLLKYECNSIPSCHKFDGGEVANCYNDISNIPCAIYFYLH